jgi:hypothetical protein
MSVHRTDGSMRGGLDRRFHTVVAVTAAVIVFAGFAQTYYLKLWFGTPELPALRHAHGLVMTSWFALFILQARLIAIRRVDLHRRVGVAGAVLAALVVVLGVATAIAGARRGASPGPPPLVFLVVPLVDMLVFAALVSAGLWLRRRPDVHRRLMLLSSLSMLAAAFGRIPLDIVRNSGPLMYFGLTDLLILICVAWDTKVHRRLHPAFAWGALLVLASHPLRLLLSGTSAWMRFATWLAG